MRAAENLGRFKVWLDDVAMSFDGRVSVGRDLMPLLGATSADAETTAT